MSETIQIALEDLGLIRVSGAKSAHFLQGQLTCHVGEVNRQQTRLGAHCDPKGRIQATFRLFCYQEAYYFLLPRNMITHLLRCLATYAVFSRIDLQDVTQQWQITGLMGNSIASVLEQYTSSMLKENALCVSESCITLSIPGPIPRLVLLNSIEKPPFLMQIPKKGCCDHWYLQDILAGIPSIYPETAAKFTPHQINYPAVGGVSFKKGCYIGQEIIVRTQHLGRSKSNLYEVAFTAKHKFPPGTIIRNEQGVSLGTLLMCAENRFKHSYQALTCLQNRAVPQTLYLESTQGPVLEILKLPTSQEE